MLLCLNKNLVSQYVFKEGAKVDFMEVACALNHIAMTGPTSHKHRLLREYGDGIPGFKECLKYIYDPYFTTGLKQAKLENGGIMGSVTMSAEEIMDYLKTNNTGTSYDVANANSFIYTSADPVWQWAATGLVTKNLQIGASVTTLNKVFGSDFIPKIGIMRGMLCPDDASGLYLCTEKIDGNRRLIFTFPYGPRAFTRSGRPDYGLVDILEEAKRLPQGYVYDCECVAEGQFRDSIALRQASASILNQGSKAKKTGVKALCFDMLPIHEYNRGRSQMSAYARKTMLAVTMNDQQSVEWLQDRAALIDNMRGGALRHGIHALIQTHRMNTAYDLKHIAALPILGIAQNKMQATELAKPIWARHGEGVMMVHIDSAYEVNPNQRRTLLKIKDIKEYTLPCVGVYEGEGKYAGMLGGIYVRYRATDGKDYIVGVGSGFTDYERTHYWAHPNIIINRMIELDSFGESVNAAGERSLNCPIFKRIAGNE